MDTISTANALMAEQDKHITDTVSRERGRLRNFIRQRVPDAHEAEDILQEVFFEYVEAYRLPETIEQVGAWLFRVARNRIIDRFRKKREVPLPDTPDDADDGHWLQEVLPSADAGPEAEYARGVLLRELYAALAELPQEQRDVFIAHEVDGCSFKELAAESGVGVNTLLARKRYAVLHLRARLQTIYDEFKSIKENGMCEINKARIFKIAVMIVSGIVALAFVVMALWNWLLPNLFVGVHEIGYVQALGVLVLSKILFGGFRGHGGMHKKMHHHHLKNMTPEEREKFKSGMSGCCGSGKQNEAAPKE